MDVQVNAKGFERFSKDPLFRNSFYMLINKGLVVSTGLIFWIIAARLYSPDDVGFATALISGSALITAFSSFGFEISLVRYINSYDKSKVFYTCLFVILGSSLVLSILYICFVRYLSPDLVFIQQPFYAVIFILFTVISSVGLITSNTFIALRDAKYSFVQNVLLTSRLPALIPLAFLGSLGIIGANFTGFIITYLIVLIIMTRFVPFKPQIDGEFIKKSFKLSFSNYIANIMYNAAFLALPIIVLNLKGGTAAGIYYIAYTAGNFLLQIPMALSASFFVEGVYGEDMRKNIVKSGIATVVLLVPAIAIFWIFGAEILGLFGHSYVDAVGLLRLVALSSLVYAVYSLFVPVLNVRMQMKAIIMLNFLIMVLLIGLSYTLISMMGIIGVGYALLATFTIVDIVIIYFSIRWGWLSGDRSID